MFLWSEICCVVQASLELLIHHGWLDPVFSLGDYPWRSLAPLASDSSFCCCCCFYFLRQRLRELRLTYYVTKMEGWTSVSASASQELGSQVCATTFSLCTERDQPRGLGGCLVEALTIAVPSSSPWLLCLLMLDYSLLTACLLCQGPQPLSPWGQGPLTSWEC